jgi:ABC-type sugar transport system substrate-binding protein
MGECGIEITNSQTGNWSATEGKQVTEAWLRESTDVQGIFAQNDEMGFGAIEALKEAGLVPGKDVKVITFDATGNAFKAMLDGDLNVTVECNPLLGPQAYEAALKAANAKSCLHGCSHKKVYSEPMTRTWRKSRRAHILRFRDLVCRHSRLQIRVFLTVRIESGASAASPQEGRQ